MWHAVYRLSDGELLSVGSVLPTGPDADFAARGLGKKDYVTRPDQVVGAVWNTTLLDFEDKSADLPANLLRHDFIARFTATEREALYAAQRGTDLTLRNKVGAFFDYVQSHEFVNIREAYVQNSVNAMETNVLIGAGRAVVILDDTGLVG